MVVRYGSRDYLYLSYTRIFSQSDELSFGNILTVTKLNLVFLLILALLITGIFLVFFKTILFIAFDEQYARAVKLPVETINYLMITLVALTIVFNIKVVGIILVISLLTIPQTIANIFTKKFEIMIWLSIIIGFLGSLSGLLLSYYLNVPSGAAIIFFLVILFFISKIFRNILTSLRIKKQIQ